MILGLKQTRQIERKENVNSALKLVIWQMSPMIQIVEDLADFRVDRQW